MATILIKPFIREEEDTVGLSSMGINKWPGTKEVLQVPQKAEKFLTGFDKDAYYLANLDEKERKKQIDKIDRMVKDFNAKYPSADLGNCSLENKFYQNLFIELGAENTIINTNSLMDAIKFHIIKTNAEYNKDFPVAPNYTEAATSNRDYKFYIADSEIDVQEEVTYKREVNKAISLLDELSTKEKAKFLLVIKYLFAPDKSYNQESDDRLYKRGDDYIKGIVDGVKTQDGRTYYKNFITVATMDREELTLKVVIKYAIYLNVIRMNKERELYYAKTGQLLGRIPDDAFKYLSSIKNKDIYDEIFADVEKEIKVY